MNLAFGIDAVCRKRVDVRVEVSAMALATAGSLLSLSLQPS